MTMQPILIGWEGLGKKLASLTLQYLNDCYLRMTRALHNDEVVHDERYNLGKKEQN